MNSIVINMITFYSFVVILLVCAGQAKICDDAIVRPCPNMDPSCVRAFFAQHSNCRPTYGPVEDRFYTKRIVLPLPHSNTTFIWEDSMVEGLSDVDIQEFYINRRTNKLVYEIRFHNVTTYCPTLTIRFYRKGLEPVDLTDYGSITYTNVFTTLTVPFDGNTIRWNEKETFVYFLDVDLPFIFGSNLYNSGSVLDTKCFILNGTIGLALQEASVFKGPYYFSLYFENNICDFYDSK